MNLTLSGKGWEQVLAEAENRFIWAGLGSSLRHTIQAPWLCPTGEWEDTPGLTRLRHIPSPRFIKREEPWGQTHVRAASIPKRFWPCTFKAKGPLEKLRPRPSTLSEAAPHLPRPTTWGTWPWSRNSPPAVWGHVCLLTLLPSRRRAKWESAEAKAALSRPKDGHSFSQ